MTDMQTSLPLLIVWPSIQNSVTNFSTPMTGEMNCPMLYLCLAHSIPSPPMSMQHMHQHNQQWYDPLHIITWSYWFINLDITCFSPLPSSIDAKSCSSFTTTRSIAPKPHDLSFTLATGPSSQVLSWSSPPWSHDSMSCLMCNELLHHHMCELCNISKPFSPSWHMLLTHMYLWTNHLCISHKHN